MTNTELLLENNSLKMEILNLRVQLAQSMAPAIQDERKALEAQLAAEQKAAAEASNVVALPAKA